MVVPAAAAAAPTVRRRPRPATPAPGSRRARCRRPRPARRAAGPSPRSRPGFSAANVTVTSAHTAPSAASPVSPFDAGRDVDGEHVGRRPDRARRSRRGSRCRRRRRSRGRTSGSVAGTSAASMTRTRTPRRRRRSAATRPSAPLLPLPATTTTRRPYAPPSSRRAARATAAPARSMSTSTGSGASASTAAISSAVRTGIMSMITIASADDVRVGDRHPPRGHALGRGQRRGPARDAQRRRAAVGAHDLDVVPAEGAEADAQRLHRRLLGREPRRQALGRVAGQRRRRPARRR